MASNGDSDDLRTQRMKYIHEVMGMKKKGKRQKAKKPGRVSQEFMSKAMQGAPMGGNRKYF